MKNFGASAKFIAAICLTAGCGMNAAAQSQPDSQAGAQSGEQAALAGREQQGANTQKTTETSPSNVTRFVTGTLINAELASSIDSKKVKQGEAVTARTAEDIKSTDGRTILPKGTKIDGRVTQASARGAGSQESSLGLIFDTATLKSGEKIPLNARIQAVGAAQGSAQDMTQVPNGEPMGGSARGPGNGATAASPGTGMNRGTPSGPSGVDGSTDNAMGTSNSNGPGQWNANTKGVVGMRNLSLNSAGADGSVISSTGKNVKLDGGTRLILITQDVPAKQETPLK
jgi:hypothetical protein